VTQRHKVVWRSARAALVGIGLLCSSVASAQGAGATSVLTGNVVDAATKAPVADVVVTATSPSLQGEQVVVTDATGLYRVPQLPPGTYTLRFEKETYRPYSRTAIDVSADRTLRLNIEMLPETAGEQTVAVVGTPPTIDVGSSQQGTTVGQDFVRNIAVARAGGLGGSTRSFEAIALTAPQATQDLYGVGINGATSPENNYLIDGLSVNDTAYGINGSPLTVEFLDEVNVITGGYMPEYGRSSGGTISGVTKSGGNEFHGSVFGTWTPGGLQGSPAPVPAAGSTITGLRELTNIGDMGATLGGYIIKDKLWFYAGVIYGIAKYSYTRSFSIARADADNNPVFDDNGVQLFDPIQGSDQKRYAQEKTWNYIGKLTYLLSSDHRVSVTITGTPTTSGGDGYYSFRQPGGYANRGPFGPNLVQQGTFNAFGNWKMTDDSINIGGELNSSFLDKRLLLDVRVGWHHDHHQGAPGDGSGVENTGNTSGLAGTSLILPTADNYPIDVVDATVPNAVKAACAGQVFADGSTRCGAGVSYVFGGPGFLEDVKLDSYQAKAVVTYLAQALGHHVLKVGFDGWWNSYDHLKTYSGGAWYFDLGGGALYQEARRYGHQTAPDQVTGAEAVVLTGKSKKTIIGGFIQDSWSIMDKVTLNLGLRYDSEQLYNKDGNLGLKLNNEWSPRIGVVWDPTQQGRSKIYANYGRYYEAIPLDLADRSISVESQLAARHACNPQTDKLAGCDAATVGRASNRSRPAQFWRNVGADTTAVDPNVKPSSNDEILAGAEYEVLPNARLGLSYTYRNLVQAIEDMSADDGNTYFIGNPGSGIGAAFPKAKRTYHAVTALFTKSFSDLWMAQVSYTWSQLRGNYDGLFRPQDGQLDPNINSTFDLAKLLVNQDGPLSGDITHTIKAYVAKEFVVAPTFSITLGLSLNANSGAPMDLLGASNESGYGTGQVFILPRGEGGRMPWVTSMDGRLAFNYRLSKDMVVTVGMDVFNIFNSQRPILYDTAYIGGTGPQGAVSLDPNENGRDPGPIPNGRNGQLDPAVYGRHCVASADPTGFTCSNGNGSLPLARQSQFTTLPDPDQNITVFQVNPNWGRPTQFQAVRSFRFTARFTF
jgi:Carboxypeptidase regulatory-like domain/TonB dependent receptor-like, beta-barrel